MTYVAAFRTHVWDDDVALAAERFFDATPSGRHVVLVDETRGPLKVPYEKVAHTEQSSLSLGLPNRPVGQSLWFNGDYGLYLVQQALPGFDHYIISEYDVAVNASLEPMMLAALERSIDIIMHEVRPSGSDWVWHESVAAAFSSPWRSLIFFMVASDRAARALLSARQELARESPGDPWPYCEGFVPSALKQVPEMSFAEVRDFVAVPDFSFRPRISARDPRASAAGTLAHPVLGSERFIAAVLSDMPARDYFDHQSLLRASLDQEPFKDVVEPLRASLVRARDHAGLTTLDQEMQVRGLATKPASHDLALNKPALSSSTSAWSHHPDPSRDANGANDSLLADDYGFHTGLEVNPWWMVDLLEDCSVDAVSLVNRTGYSGRFRTFRVESSFDSAQWTVRCAKLDLSAVSSDVLSPWVNEWSPPFVGRYVRVVLLDTCPLHLRRVQVFGSPLSSHAG